MNPRVTLSRIIAVNWYGYRQFIDVHGLTLITGANGSGKSALLDLIQFVLLGEQTSRFNKAAAGAGSGRTLRGYCLCDTNATSGPPASPSQASNSHGRLTKTAPSAAKHGALASNTTAPPPDPAPHGSASPNASRILTSSNPATPRQTPSPSSPKTNSASAGVATSTPKSGTARPPISTKWPSAPTSDSDARK